MLEVIQMDYATPSSCVNNRHDFLLCQSCFWCASYFNFEELSIISCSLCDNGHIELHVGLMKNLTLSKVVL